MRFFIPIFILLSGILQTLVAADSEEVISIGSYRQLFIDDFLIEETVNITRRICQVSKHPQNPIVRADRPWEGCPRRE